MTNKWKFIAGAAAVLSLINLGLVILSFHSSQQLFGAVGGKLIENYDPYVRYNGGVNTALPFKTTSTMQLGSNGTAIAQESFGSCKIWTAAHTIAATSSQQIVCQGGSGGNITAITGIPANGTCALTMASSTNTKLGTLIVAGASASSTAGSIVARLVNLTGTTFTWTAAASSSAQWKYTCLN
ncbi:MAG: hypothetical protein KGL39_30200 [Patescibacteria group bacterium]|nr:hypothetical protein [Patescibacteria group bacterium]